MTFCKIAEDDAGNQSPKLRSYLLPLEPITSPTSFVSHNVLKIIVSCRLLGTWTTAHFIIHRCAVPEPHRNSPRGTEVLKVGA